MEVGSGKTGTRETEGRFRCASMKDGSQKFMPLFFFRLPALVLFTQQAVLSYRVLFHPDLLLYILP